LIHFFWKDIFVKNNLHLDNLELFNKLKNNDLSFIKLEKSIKKSDLKLTSNLLKNTYICQIYQDNILMNEALKAYHNYNEKPFEIIKMLLNDQRIDPSIYFNLNIKSFSCCNVIIDLLWTNKKVKKSLEKDDKELYDILIKQDLKEKIIKF
jgi:hypothetical protein